METSGRARTEAVLPWTIPWLSYAFVAGKVRLSWSDVRLGLERQLLDPWAPVEMAARLLASGEEPVGVDIVVELAGKHRGESVRACVEQLAALESAADPDESLARWAYLTLAWLHEHRERYADSQYLVDCLYYDFDYPQEIATFGASAK